MHIQFQTSDLVPPPYAYAVEINLEPSSDLLKVAFELTYLDRDGLTEDEITDEGFSDKDDLKWEGTLNSAWLAYFNEVLANLDLIKKNELRSGEDFWEIKSLNKSGYPVDYKYTGTFIQEIQQAAFEAKEREAPLSILIERISNEGKKSYAFKASFKDRIYNEEQNGINVPHKWEELNELLKDVFMGEFRSEQASHKTPNKSGIFLNIGDDLWYELGKSYLIQPSKIQRHLN
jgi:hypothetical protein